MTTLNMIYRMGFAQLHRMRSDAFLDVPRAFSIEDPKNFDSDIAIPVSDGKGSGS